MEKIHKEDMEWMKSFHTLTVASLSKHFQILGKKIRAVRKGEIFKYKIIMLILFSLLHL